MRLTIDSTDDLDRVLEVVGSLFGVRVQVAPYSPADAATTTQPTPAGSSTPSRRTAARRTTARGTTARGTTARRGRRASSISETANRKASTAQVRQWARESGLQVSDRGRIPATVLEAYQAAH